MENCCSNISVGYPIIMFVGAHFTLFLLCSTESISTSEGPDANGLFTEKATLRKTLLRKDLGAMFECRIESTALQTTVRYQLNVDLQGKYEANCIIIVYCDYSIRDNIDIPHVYWFFLDLFQFKLKLEK